MTAPVTSGLRLKQDADQRSRRDQEDPEGDRHGAPHHNWELALPQVADSRNKRPFQLRALRDRTSSSAQSDSRLGPDGLRKQYTSSGTVAGIAGNVQPDRFNGSVEELHDLAANGLRAHVVAVDYPSAMVPGETAAVTLVLENLNART